MSEAVQEPVQGRDGAVRDEEAVVTVPWRPRSDGKTALLVSERATVFDRKARVVTEPVDPAAEVRDPIFDHQSGARWSPELVHCRLLVAGEVYMRLPPVLRSGQLRSVLGSAALAAQGGERRSPPSPMEISIANWTFDRVFELPEESRQLVQARAFGHSFDSIVAALRARRGKENARKRTVIDWYQNVRRVLAGDWQLRKHPVDTTSFERWRLLFADRPK